MVPFHTKIQNSPARTQLQERPTPDSREKRPGQSPPIFDDPIVTASVVGSQDRSPVNFSPICFSTQPVQQKFDNPNIFGCQERVNKLTQECQKIIENMNLRMDEPLFTSPSSPGLSTYLYILPNGNFYIWIWRPRRLIDSSTIKNESQRLIFAALIGDIRSRTINQSMNDLCCGINIASVPEVASIIDKIKARINIYIDYKMGISHIKQLIFLNCPFKNPDYKIEFDNLVKSAPITYDSPIDFNKFMATLYEAAILNLLDTYTTRPPASGYDGGTTLPHDGHSQSMALVDEFETPSCAYLALMKAPPSHLAYETPSRELDGTRGDLLNERANLLDRSFNIVRYMGKRGIFILKKHTSE